MSSAPSGNRPVHLRLPYLGLALIGGTFGTAAREAITLIFPSTDGTPWAIFTVNILGAFVLGLLLEALTRMGPDVGRRRRLRILLGTGFMGGFTTYSALATDTASLLGEGDVGAGIIYGLGTVLIGGLATWAGIVAATAWKGRSPNAPVRRTDDDVRGGGGK
ncbi:fluoride efflux transporter FluC [Brevibacterium zhoupengii]|uniref:fluoride efflux transporter FluC n=1 Tax=Brevibacterium zhoupengii TaxID=2898795 RepID=UPI001E65BFCC|nr:CrcB family protein [Brevibacterium zhoupengii]